MPALNKKEKRKLCDYISGYVDGEGCFSISFSKRKKLLVGWETKASFSVSQNEDRSQVLYLMQDYFGCGSMRRDFSDKTLKYEVRSIENLVQKVIPHFEKYPLLSSKQKDFESFKRVCYLMLKKKHRTSSGLRQVMAVAFKMNPSGRRKYTKEDILNELR